MTEELSRAELLLGGNALERLSRSRVAVFGVGGVGGYAVEALARCGIGALDLIDSDCVSRSNINRQLLALQSTVGQRKVDVAAARIHDIRPETGVRAYPVFFLPENADHPIVNPSRRKHGIRERGASTLTVCPPSDFSPVQ